MVDQSQAASDFEKALKTAFAKYKKDNNLAAFRSARTKAINKYRKAVGL